MKIVKRHSDLNIEFITNGIILSICGRNVDDDYINEKMYIPDITALTEVLIDIEIMPEVS